MVHISRQQIIQLEKKYNTSTPLPEVHSHNFLSSCSITAVLSHIFTHIVTSRGQLPQKFCSCWNWTTITSVFISSHHNTALISQTGLCLKATITTAVVDNSRNWVQHLTSGNTSRQLGPPTRTTSEGRRLNLIHAKGLGKAWRQVS